MGGSAALRASSRHGSHWFGLRAGLSTQFRLLEHGLCADAARPCGEAAIRCSIRAFVHCRGKDCRCSDRRVTWNRCAARARQSGRPVEHYFSFADASLLQAVPGGGGIYGTDGKPRFHLCQQRLGLQRSMRVWRLPDEDSAAGIGGSLSLGRPDDECRRRAALHWRCLFRTQLSQPDGIHSGDLVDFQCASFCARSVGGSGSALRSWRRSRRDARWPWDRSGASGACLRVPAAIREPA